MLVACKKNGATDQIQSTETLPEGVVVEAENNSLYDYSYEQQAGGTLLFSIEGKWGENQAWVVQDKEDAVATAEQLSQTAKAVKYRFSPQKKGGYSDFEISLCDKETGKVTCYYIVSVMASEDGTSLSVLSVYFEEISEEVNIGENVEQENKELTEEELQKQRWEEQERKEAQEAADEFDKTIGTLSFPEQFTSLSKMVLVEDVEENGRTWGQVSFEYKDRKFMCAISKTLSFSELQELAGISVEEYEPKVIYDIEVQCYEEEESVRYIRWDAAGYKYILMERKIEDETGFEVAELLLKQQ